MLSFHPACFVKNRIGDTLKGEERKLLFINLWLIFLYWLWFQTYLDYQICFAAHFSNKKTAITRFRFTAILYLCWLLLNYIASLCMRPWFYLRSAEYWCHFRLIWWLCLWAYLDCVINCLWKGKEKNNNCWTREGSHGVLHAYMHAVSQISWCLVTSISGKDINHVWLCGAIDSMSWIAILSVRTWGKES